MTLTLLLYHSIISSRPHLAAVASIFILLLKLYKRLSTASFFFFDVYLFVPPLVAVTSIIERGWRHSVI
jgi:hypothetical protein